MISALLGLILLGQEATPKAVSLDFHFATVKQVCDEITKQSGVNFVVVPDLRDRTIALKLKNRPVRFASESIASVLGCKSVFLGGECRIGLEKDGRPDFVALIKSAEAQRRKAYSQFVAELKRLGARSPDSLRQEADSILTRSAELERSGPSGWREERRKILNTNRLLLDLVDSPLVLLVAKAGFSGESLMAGTNFAWYTNDAGDLNREFDLGLENTNGLVSVAGMVHDAFVVQTYLRLGDGRVAQLGGRISLYAEMEFSDRKMAWPEDSEIQQVPSLPYRLSQFVRFSQDGRYMPGECISEVAASADCEYVSTTDRAEFIQSPTHRDLAKWAEWFMQQNGGILGWKDGTLLYRHLRTGPFLLQTQIRGDWKRLEGPTSPEFDPELSEYALFLNKLTSNEVRYLDYDGGPMTSVSVQPLLTPAVSRYFGMTSGSSKSNFLNHKPINADEANGQQFVAAFLECVLRWGGESAGKALLRYAESGYSLKGLQAFCDTVPTGEVTFKDLDGNYCQASESFAESKGATILGKVMDYRFRFGYSDAESSGVSFFLRVPISQLPK